MARTKSGGPVSTAVERARKSEEELVARGGRRFNLKLSPEANAALKIIVEAEGHKDDTAAINQTLIERGQELKLKQDNVREEKK
jgi:hypothetical protein